MLALSIWPQLVHVIQNLFLLTTVPYNSCARDNMNTRPLGTYRAGFPSRSPAFRDRPDKAPHPLVGKSEPYLICCMDVDCGTHGGPRKGRQGKGPADIAQITRDGRRGG